MLTSCEQDQDGTGTKPVPSWSCSQAVSTTVRHTIAVCTVKNCWWRAEELSETCRVLFQKNKFEKLVHLVGFIIRILRVYWTGLVLLLHNQTGSALIPLASCQHTCMTYTIAVCAVKNCWWWTGELSETCRVSFEKQIWEISASSWFYYMNLSQCTVTLPWSRSQAVSKPVWHIPLLCVRWKTADDWQRNCPKCVEFRSKHKFEKLVHLVGFIIRMYHDARSPERQICKIKIYIRLIHSNNFGTARIET